MSSINSIQKDNPFSYHIFLFAFKWEHLDENGQLGYLQQNKSENNRDKSSIRFDLKEFEKVIYASANPKNENNGQWERKTFSINDIPSYNEYNYFYNFVSPILYDLDESLYEDLQKDSGGQAHFLRHYEYNLDSDSKYIIKVNDDIYELDIEDILLNIYSMGVGVLSFHLANRKESQKAKDVILKINQFGRRIYPPFFGMNQSQINGHYQDYANTKFGRGLEGYDVNGNSKGGVKTIELANHIELKINGLEQSAERFEKYEDSSYFQNSPFQLPNFIAALFPNHAEALTTHLKHEASVQQKKRLYLLPVTDDRMHVICWYGNDDLISYKTKNRTHLNYKKSNKSIKNQKPSNKKWSRLNDPRLSSSASTIQYNYHNNEWWYKYIFVDGGSLTCENDNMLQQLLLEHTYHRWANAGTLYGISRYSMVGLTSSLAVLQKNDVAFLMQHMISIYYKMTELCLVQRASLLKFADEVTYISNLSDDDYDKLSQRMTTLYKMYIQFVNKIYFREITTQEQGIELYQMLQNKMEIVRDVNNLNDEIQELHQYVQLRHSQQEAKLQEEQAEKEGRLERLLAIIATIFLVPSLITGFYGMNVFNDELQIGNRDTYIGVTITILVLTFIATIFVNYKTNRILSNKVRDNRNSIFNNFPWFITAAIALLLITVSAFPCLCSGKRSLKKYNGKINITDTLHILYQDSIRLSIPAEEIKGIEIREFK